MSITPNAQFALIVMAIAWGMIVLERLFFISKKLK